MTVNGVLTRLWQFLSEFMTSPMVSVGFDPTLSIYGYAPEKHELDATQFLVQLNFNYGDAPFMFQV
jgi:hypothetical protein